MAVTGAPRAVPRDTLDKPGFAKKTRPSLRSTTNSKIQDMELRSTSREVDATVNFAQRNLPCSNQSLLPLMETCDVTGSPHSSSTTPAMEEVKRFSGEFQCDFPRSHLCNSRTDTWQAASTSFLVDECDVTDGHWHDRPGPSFPTVPEQSVVVEPVQMAPDHLSPVVQNQTAMLPSRPGLVQVDSLTSSIHNLDSKVNPKESSTPQVPFAATLQHPPSVDSEKTQALAKSNANNLFCCHKQSPYVGDSVVPCASTATCNAPELHRAHPALSRMTSVTPSAAQSCLSPQRTTRTDSSPHPPPMGFRIPQVNAVSQPVQIFAAPVIVSPKAQQTALHVQNALPQQLPSCSPLQGLLAKSDEHPPQWRSHVGNIQGSSPTGRMRVSPSPNAPRVMWSRPNSYMQPRYKDFPVWNPSSFQLFPMPMFARDPGTPKGMRTQMNSRRCPEPLDTAYSNLADGQELSPMAPPGCPWETAPRGRGVGGPPGVPYVDDPFGLNDADPAPLPPPPPAINQSSMRRARSPIQESSWQHVLEVVLGDDRWDTIRFSAYDNLFHSAATFLCKHHLNPGLQSRLVQMMQRMVTDGESSFSIDIVDLLP